MGSKVVLEISIDDKGSAIIKEFSQNTKTAMGELGKQTESTSGYFDKMKGSVVAWAGGMVAAYVSVNQAMEAMDLARKAQQSEQAFQTVAVSAKENANEVVAAMRRMTAGTIDESDLVQKALKGMTQGLKGEDLIKISEAARIAARTSGTDVSVAFETITDAIANNMPRALRQYGLITKEQMGLVNKAVADGAEEVNLLGIVYANAALKAAQMGGMMDTTAEQAQRFRAQVQDLKETVGGALLRGLQAVMGVLQGMASGFMYATSGIAKFMEGVDLALAAYNNLVGSKDEAKALKEKAESWKQFAKDAFGTAAELSGKATANIVGMAAESEKANAQSVEDAKKNVAAEMERLKAIGDRAREEKKAATEKEQAEKQIIEAIRKTEVEKEAIGKTAYEKDLIRIESEAQKYREKKVSEIDIAKFVTLEKSGAEEKLRLHLIDLNKLKLDDQQDWLVQETMMQQNSAEKTKAIYDATYGYDNKKLNEYIVNHKYAFDQRTAEIEALSDLDIGTQARNAQLTRKWEEDRAKWILNINKSMGEEIARFTGNEFDLKEKAIEEEYRLRKLRMVDSVVLEKWRKMELDKILEERTLKEGTFWQGIAVAYQQDLRRQETWGKEGAKVWREIFGRGGAVEGTLNTFFEDVFHGHLRSAMDYFNAFKDAVISAFARMIAEMIAQWIAAQAAGLLGFGGGINVGGNGIGIGLGGVGGGGNGTGLIGLGQSAYSAYSSGGVGSAASAAYSYLTGGASLSGTGASIGVFLGGTNSGVAVSGIEAGMTATEAYGAGLGASMGAEAGAGAAGAGAGAEGAGAGMAAGGAWVGPAFAAFTAAMLAYGFYSLATAPHIPLNPFEPAEQAGTNANPFSLTPMQFLALKEAGLNFDSVTLQDQLASNPWMQDAFKPAIDAIQANPFFNPENVYKIYSEMLGRPATQEDVMGGGPFNWYHSSPAFQEAVQNLIPLVPIGIEDWLSNQEGGGTGGGGARGMVIDEPIIGLGMRSGGHYAFGEAGSEAVIPLGDGNTVKTSGGGRGLTINFNIGGNLIGDRRTFDEFAQRIFEGIKSLEARGH